MTSIQDNAANIANLDLLRLAATLMGDNRNPDTILSTALEQLQQIYPDTVWVLLSRIDHQAYRAVAGAPISHEDIKELGHMALGCSPRFKFDGIVARTIRFFNRPSWCAWPRESDDPKLILGVWCLRDGPRPGAAALGLICEMITNAHDAAEQLHTLRQLTTIDSLTQIFNRKAIMDALGREKSRALRNGSPLSVLYVDVDKFKVINDNHGHAMGDRALVTIAQAIGCAVRDCDFVGRVGGDEFVVVLPGADLGGAQRAARRIQAEVTASRVVLDNVVLRMSVTVGASCMDEGANIDIIDVADRRMLDSKQSQSRRDVSIPDAHAAA